MRKLALTVVLLMLMMGFSMVQSQELPNCNERDYLAEFPRVVARLWCIEKPLGVGDAGEWAYTALAFTADGTFYATRPSTGELLVLLDSNGDRMPDSSEVLASGMRFPNGLAVDGNTVYIIGDGTVYRYLDGELSIVADDLPQGRGFIASAIAVYNERLYIGIPFPCDTCQADNELYGSILSMDLQGENRQIEARGLRYPSGILIREGTVWVTDTARDNLAEGVNDEINRFELNGETIPHFGFPYCYGLENSPDGESDFDCSQARSPQWGLVSRSNPFALTWYGADTFPWLKNEILVSLAGAFNNNEIYGYSLIAVHEFSDEEAEAEIILPADEALMVKQVYPSVGRIISVASSSFLNQRGAGIWPHRIYGVAVSPEGWLYVSVGGEGIFVLRPGDYTNERICQQWRECNG